MPGKLIASHEFFKRIDKTVDTDAVIDAFSEYQISYVLTSQQDMQQQRFVLTQHRQQITGAAYSVSVLLFHRLKQPGGQTERKQPGL